MTERDLDNLILQICGAINANNGRCGLIEDALIRADTLVRKYRELSRAFDNIRDAVLHDRFQLAEMGVDSDITNAVLGIIDDHDPRPIA